MTSAVKASANRQNAQRSTGPRTPDGKSRTRLNALRHGLSATPGLSLNKKVDRLTSLIEQACSIGCSHRARQQAAIIAENEIMMARVRALRVAQLESGMSGFHGEAGREGGGTSAMMTLLLSLDRYERRASSSRRKAAEIFSAIQEMSKTA